MALAVAIPDAFVVDMAQTEDNGEGWLYMSIAPEDYDGFKRLPAAVTFQGRTYGKSGWNSDNGHVAYSTGRPVARTLRK
jgi:hypothetical protein